MNEGPYMVVIAVIITVEIVILHVNFSSYRILTRTVLSRGKERT